MADNPAERGKHGQVPMVKQFNGRRRAIFLTALAQTGSLRGAAARTNVNPSTVYDHAQKDPTFAESIERARNEWEHALLEKIAKAAEMGTVTERKNGSRFVEPGDWRAAAWLLEHAPHTRDHYAGVMRQKVQLGGDPDNPIKVENVADAIPTTGERLGQVFALLVRAGVVRYPESGESGTVIEGEWVEANGNGSAHAHSEDEPESPE